MRFHFPNCVFYQLAYFPVPICYFITGKKALQRYAADSTLQMIRSKVCKATTLPYSRVSWMSKSAKNASFLFTLFKHFSLIRNYTHQLSASCVKHRLQASEYDKKKVKNKRYFFWFTYIAHTLLLNLIYGGSLYILACTSETECCLWIKLKKSNQTKK